MRTYHDQLAKRLLHDMLALVADVRLEAEVVASARRIDVAFVPRSADAAMLPRLGLLGDIAATPGFIEPFSRTPGIDAIYDCIGKLLAARNRRPRPGRDEPRPAPPPRILWVLSPGRPEQALRILRMRRLRGWPAGVYAVSAGFPLRVIVLEELARTHRTLFLRMLGRDRTREAALRELERVSESSAEARLAVSILLSFYREIRPITRPTTEEQAIVNILEKLEAWEQEIEAKMLRRMFAKRLGRPLTRAEARALDRRIQALGPSSVEDVVLSRTPSRLAAWLTGPDPT